MDLATQNRNTLLDFAVLLSLPPNLVNRDDTGAPKTTLHAGVWRLSPSSQSLKRALRRGTTLGSQVFRTARMPEHIMEALGYDLKPLLETDLDEMTEEQRETRKLLLTLRVALYTPKGEAKKGRKGAQQKLEALLAGKDPADEEEKAENKSEGKKPAKDKGTAGMIFFAKSEVDALIEHVRKLVTEGHPDLQDADKLHQNFQKFYNDLSPKMDMLTLAAFGRMNPGNMPLKDTRDGALQMGRAISVDRYVPHSDYYSTVDDFAERYNAARGMGAGAGFIGERDFSPGVTVLVQGQLDLSLMAHNAGFESLGVVRDEAISLARTIVEGLTKFFPSAGQGSFRTSPRASYAMVRLSDGGACFDLSPAFDVPVAPGSKDPLDPSEDAIRIKAARRLRKYTEAATFAYGEDRPKIEFSIDDLGDDNVLRRLSDFGDAVEALLRERI